MEQDTASLIWVLAASTAKVLREPLKRKAPVRRLPIAALAFAPCNLFCRAAEEPDVLLMRSIWLISKIG